MVNRANQVYNEMRMREMRQRGAQEQLAHTFRPEWQRRLEHIVAGVYRSSLLVIGRLAASFGRRLEVYAIELEDSRTVTGTPDLERMAE